MVMKRWEVLRGWLALAGGEGRRAGDGKEEGRTSLDKTSITEEDVVVGWAAGWC